MIFPTPDIGAARRALFEEKLDALPRMGEISAHRSDIWSVRHAHILEQLSPAGTKCHANGLA